MKITNIININSSPEKVFYWISDPDRAKQWMKSVLETEIFNQTPEMIGTTFRELVGKRGRGFEVTGEITDFKENQLIAFHLTSKINDINIEYCCEKIENGTRLVQDAEIRFKSVFKIISTLLQHLVKNKIIEQVNSEFATLKYLCEQET